MEKVHGSVRFMPDLPLIGQREVELFLYAVCSVVFYMIIGVF
jgi:hypothetical protein